MGTGATTGAGGQAASGPSSAPAAASGNAPVGAGSSTGSSTGSSSSTVVVPGVTVDGFSSSSGSPPPAAPGTCDPTAQAVQPVGITGVQMARVQASGALQPTTSFSSATDRRIIAVVALDDRLVVTGTVITFVRVLGCKYTPSQTYTATKPLSHFEVAFTASTQPFPPGHYLLRFYVNRKPGWDAAYDVS